MTIDSHSLPSLRRATADDAAAVGAIWRTGWHDAHDGHVAAELVALRTDESFDRRAAERVADTTVAVVGGEVAGFVMLAGSEAEQVYVAREFRGSGVADLLLDSAERQIADHGHRTAWLAVVAGNVRARRFYERRGWADDGPIAYPAAGNDGPIEVPCHRYVKRVAR